MYMASKAGRVSCRIHQNDEIAHQIFDLLVDYPADFEIPEPGQFVNLYCRHQGRLLPRPISVCEIVETDSEKLLRLVYAIQGAGTEEFSRYSPGETIQLFGPLGNGFFIPDSPGTALLIGGGAGTPPMVELAKQLNKRGWQPEIVVGFSDEPYLVDSLEQYGPVYVATDSGAYGFCGNVIELIFSKKLETDYFYACGSAPMLRAVQSLSARLKNHAQLSLEERMGCGFGGCVGCVVKISTTDNKSFVYKKVCKDGPVFSGTEVMF